MAEEDLKEVKIKLKQWKLHPPLLHRHKPDIESKTVAHSDIKGGQQFIVMKKYCHSCKIFVAEIKDGSHIRKGAEIVCAKCLSRYNIADNMAKMARDQAKSSTPEFLKDLFSNLK